MQLSTPRFEWGRASHESIGKVKSLDKCAGTVVIDFPAHEAWNGLTSELERASAEEYAQHVSDDTERSAQLKAAWVAQLSEGAAAFGVDERQLTQMLDSMDADDLASIMTKAMEEIGSMDGDDLAAIMMKAMQVHEAVTMAQGGGDGDFKPGERVRSLVSASHWKPRGLKSGETGVVLRVHGSSNQVDVRFGDDGLVGRVSKHEIARIDARQAELGGFRVGEKVQSCVTQTHWIPAAAQVWRRRHDRRHLRRCATCASPAS